MRKRKEWTAKREDISKGNVFDKNKKARTHNRIKVLSVVGDKCLVKNEFEYKFEISKKDIEKKYTMNKKAIRGQEKLYPPPGEKH